MSILSTAVEPQEEIKLAKQTLREQMRQKLRAVPDEVFAQWSALLCARALSLIQRRQQPGTIALFGGLRTEPDLVSVLMPRLYLLGWRVAFFRIEGETLIPHLIEKEKDLVRGSMKVWEPSSNTSELAISELTLLLVPCLGFSPSHGTRLGRGGGYYDRLLALPELHATRLGIAFEAQAIQDLPCEPHDAIITGWVTEKETYASASPPIGKT